MKNNPHNINEVLGIEAGGHKPLAFFGIKVHESHESVREWVRWCKRQGFGGFNMIIATECQGRANEQWIKMLMDSYEVALETAREEGLEVWIFDDFGYPSGTAGGQVCSEPSFRLKRLIVSYDCNMQPKDSIMLKLPEKFVAAGILAGKDTYRKLDMKKGEIFKYTAGETAERLVIVSWEYDEHASKSSCKSYPGDPAMSCIDMLNPKATKKFLEVMHERYYERFSAYFGTVIKGFFYDEPYLSFEFPWTEELPEYFKRKKEYNIIDILPNMLANSKVSSKAEIKKYLDDYFDVWTDMAANNFYGELSVWCKKHGVLLSGHMDLDHHLNTLSTISGHFYKNMAFNDRPAVDVIWAQIEPGVFTDFPRYAGSVKRLLGRGNATSETFAGMGQGLHADLMKYITDHQVIRGINDFHLMYSNNNPSPEYCESPQMPNHMLQEPFGKLIYKRIASAANLASVGTPVAGTALYIPAFDIYRAQLELSQVGINNAEKLPWEWVNDISKELNYLPYDFDYIWDEAISSLKLVEGGFMTGSGYIIENIILPPNCTLVESVINKLKEFRDKGGKIISVFRVNWNLEKEAEVCSELYNLGAYLKRSIFIYPQENISAHISKYGSKTIYMLLNETERNINAEISIEGTGRLYEVELLDGSTNILMQKSPFKFHSTFDACQMKVYITDNAAYEYNGNTETEAADEERCICFENWTIELPDKSICKLHSNHWLDWNELGYPSYSGFMKYRAEFEWNCNYKTAILKMPGLRYHAIINIDGNEAGRILFRPYELKLSGLCKGRHSVEIIVYNTAANEVCGTYEIQKLRYSKRFAHLADYDRKRLKSGILQPPVILPIVCKNL